MQKFEKIIAALLALIITTTSFTMVANADDSKIIEQCYMNANSEYTNLSVSGIKSTCIAKITTTFTVGSECIIKYSYYNN